MRSLPDIPPPFQTPDAVRSDVAPRASSGATPTDPPRHSQLDVGIEGHEFPPGAFSPDDAIDDQIADLERWAHANEKRDRDESVRFWVLRGTAFLAAVFAAVLSDLGPVGPARVSTVLAGVAALFIAIDAAWPGGAFRNPYRRAVFDLRALQNKVKLRWDKVRLAYPDPTGTKRVAHALALLDGIQAKREDIGRYLGNAEASPGIKRRSSAS